MLTGFNSANGPKDMPVAVKCMCGAQFQAKDELQGKSVPCPRCQQTLAIPRSATPEKPHTKSDAKIRVACQCGQAFQANPNLAGKQVPCPACQQPLTIAPASPSSSSAQASAAPSSFDELEALAGSDDPFGLNAVPSGPPGLGVPGLTGTAMPQMPQQGYGFSPTANSAGQHYRSVTPQKPTRQRARMSSETDVVTMVIGILCILHGLGRTASLYRIAYLFSGGGITSLWGIISLATAAVSLGIAAAGFGLVTHQHWAKQVGSLAAIGYFLFMAGSIIVAMIGIAPATTGIGWGLSFYMIPRIIAESLVPGALLYRVTQTD